MRRIYLDWNATAPLRAEARAAMLAVPDGNPSSIHAEGRAARGRVEAARAKVAALVGAEAKNVVLTSGGTEANALALSPSAQCQRLLVSAVEHVSVLAGGRFEEIEQIPVEADGRIDVEALRRALEGGPPALISLMLANNETGVVQPVCEAARLVHDRGGLLHVDAVQAPGRIPCDMNEIGADLMTLSAHKLGGPKGVGALVKCSEAVPLVPLIRGGGQERGARAGTENVPAIAGFGAAATAIRRDAGRDQARMRALRDRLEAGLQEITPAVVIFGASAERLPNTTLFALEGMRAETAVIAFDLDGVAVSSGSACSSGKVAPSHVLAAMGVPAALARGAIRVSLGPATTESDIDGFLDAWIKVSGALVKRSPGIAA